MNKSYWPMKLYISQNLYFYYHMVHVDWNSEHPYEYFLYWFFISFNLFSETQYCHQVTDISSDTKFYQKYHQLKIMNTFTLN